ncbi:MAG: hypothetical protein WKF94_03655 [Solirubrobacteraceae bacterium]
MTDLTTASTGIPLTAATPTTGMTTAADIACAVTQEGATGEDLASVLEAGLAKLDTDSVQTFDVPGWDTLRVRAKAPKSDDRSTAVKIVAHSTDAVLLRKGEDWMEVRHGWRGVAEVMGRPEMSTSEVIRRVLGNEDRLNVFADEIMSWVIGRKSTLDRLLDDLHG